MTDKPKKLNKIESMLYHAYEAWGWGDGVRDDVVSALDKSGMTLTRPVEQYYRETFGKESPEYDENYDDDEFLTISVFTDKGNALLADIKSGIANKSRAWNSKYEGVFE